MNYPWYYLEQETARRIEIYNREFAEARLEQQLIKQRFKAILKSVRHFASRGIKTMTGLVRSKVSSTLKR